MSMNKFRLVKAGRPLLLIVILFLAACDVELYSDLSERQVNQMLFVLLAGNIDASKESLGKGRYAVLVPKSEMAQAVDLLNAEGLPGEQYADMEDMYKKEGLISSPMEERIRYMYSLSQSIAETLTNIDGVVVARVHVAVPETDKFSGEIRPTSASVFIKYQEGFTLAGSRSEIKRIVESSIEGLSYQNIAVYFSPTKKRDSVEPSVNLVKFGPLKVAESSLIQTKWITLALLFSLFSLLCSTVWLLIKSDNIQFSVERVKGLCATVLSKKDRLHLPWDKKKLDKSTSTDKNSKSLVI